MSEGYWALRESAAWFDLSARGRIRAAGADRARFLHAMSTNHIQQLRAGEGCYAFFLNAQGRIQADAYVLCFPDYFLLDTEPETRERLVAHLDRFIIADDVTLEDLSEALSCIAIEGPGAGDALAKLGAPAPGNPYAHVPWAEGFVAQLSATGAVGYRIFGPAARKPALVAELRLAGIPEADAGAVLAARLEYGKPRYGDDLSEATLPHESGQMHAVHFSKGCYLGQEIVERVRSRGRVNRMLSRLRIEAVQPPARGAKVWSGDKEAGEITSSAYSPAMECVLAYAFLRVEAIRPGATFEVDGRPAVRLA